MNTRISSSNTWRHTGALALLLAAGAACSTSFAQTITSTSALPAANELVEISGEGSFQDPPGTITYMYSPASLTETGVLANGAFATTTATLNQIGAAAQVTNGGYAGAAADYFLEITGPGAPGSTVQLTLSNALLSTSGVNTSLTYNVDYQLAASLSISQATAAGSNVSIVSGSAPINGSLNLNGTYTVALGEPIYITESVLAEYAYNGSTGIVWSASVDPVISLSSSVANPSAYTFAYSEGAPIFAVPEPGTYWMMLAGCGVLAAVARGRRRERGVLRLAA